MTQTAKRALFALVISALLLACAPFFVGKLAYAAIDAFIADMNQRDEYSARWRSYESGWFSSIAVVEFNAAELAGATVPAREPLWLPVQLTLNHGPIFFDSGARFGWLKGDAVFDAEHSAAATLKGTALGDSARAEADKRSALRDHNRRQSGTATASTRLQAAPLTPEVKAQERAGRRVVTADFVMNLAGIVAFEQQSKALTLHLDDSVYTLAGLAGKGTYGPYAPLRFRGGADSITLRRGNGTTEIRDLHIAVDANLHKRHGPFAVPGSLTLSFKRLSMVNSEDIVLQVDDLDLLWALTIDADAQLGDLILQTSSSRTQLFGEVIDDAETNLELRRMSLEFFGDALELLQNSPSSQRFDRQDALPLLPLITQQLLPPGPQILLKRLNFTLPEGSFSAQAIMQVEAQPNSPVDLASAVRTTQAELKLELARSLALRLLKMQAASAVDEQMFTSGRLLNDIERKTAIETTANERLEQLLQKGYLAPRGEMLTSELELHEGVVTVNEQQLLFPF